ncbi:MAG: YncE family protein [Planctomycetota bacterium]|nr:YncE family protein [Planctomycetota bacterium]
MIRKILCGLSLLGLLPLQPMVAQELVDASGPSCDYYLYAAAESADEVYKIKFDGQRATVIGVVPVGYQATEIEGAHGLTVSLDGKHWFVTTAHGKPNGILYKHSTATDKVVGQTTLGLFPATMQISKATGLLYCVNFNLHGKMVASSVSIVDPAEMVEVARTQTGSMPHGSRLSADGLSHFSCSMMSGELFEIDAASFEVKRKLQLEDPTKIDRTPVRNKLPKQARHQAHESAGDHLDIKGMPKPTWVHPHPKGGIAYVCLNGIAQVAEVDLRKWRVMRRFPTAKGPYNVEVTPDGAKLLVSYKSSQSFGILDTKTGKELARIPSTRKITHGVVISPDGRYGFVTSEGIGSEQGAVDVVDMRTNKLVSAVKIGLQAGGIAFWKIVPRGR